MTFKDRHSSNINNVFWGVRINTKNIAFHKYYFLASFFGMLISMTIEGVWNTCITKRRCESLPNNKFSPLSPSVRRKKIMKLYDEMPTHVLAEYKDMGDSTVL